MRPSSCRCPTLSGGGLPPAATTVDATVLLPAREDRVAADLCDLAVAVRGDLPLALPGGWKYDEADDWERASLWLPDTRDDASSSSASAVSSSSSASAAAISWSCASSIAKPSV